MEFIFNTTIQIKVPVEGTLYLGDSEIPATNYETWNDDNDDNYLYVNWENIKINQKIKQNNIDLLFKLNFSCTACSIATLKIHNAELIDPNDNIIKPNINQIEHILQNLNLYIKINYKSKFIQNDYYNLNGNQEPIIIEYN